MELDSEAVTDAITNCSRRDCVGPERKRKVRQWWKLCRLHLQSGEVGHRLEADMFKLSTGGCLKERTHQN